MPFDRNDRCLFDRSAEAYDTARPGYPECMIEDLIHESGMPETGRILEVGCGTGQLTVPLAERGYAITAVELGSNLSRLAAANLDPFPNATIVCADFERWDAKPNAYDLVVSAQAFHWIEPTIGYPKARAALHSGGHLALVWNLFPGGETPVYRALDEVYRVCAPELCTAPGRRSLEERVERTTREMRASGLFGEPSVRWYPWTVTYTSAEYPELLRTFSDHLALDPSDSERLLAAVRSAIDRFGGTIDRPQVTALFLARPRRGRHVNGI
jgi:SAM-dependent methyltransferase